MITPPSMLQTLCQIISEKDDILQKPECPYSRTLVARKNRFVKENSQGSVQGDFVVCYSSLRVSAIFMYAALIMWESTVDMEVIIKIVNARRKGVAVMGEWVLKYESIMLTVKK